MSGFLLIYYIIILVYNINVLHVFQAKFHDLFGEPDREIYSFDRVWIIAYKVSYIKLSKPVLIGNILFILFALGTI